MEKYYKKSIECMSEKVKRDLQLYLFNQQLRRAQKTKAYKARLPKKISDLSEIQNLPFTTKKDLQQDFPYGFLAIAPKKITRFNATSGTTGIPTLVFFSEKDLRKIEERSARQFYMTGFRKGNICQCMMGFGLFAGGIYHMSGASRIGTVIPMGSGNTQRQISFLKNLKAEFCFATPGYLQYLLHSLSEEDKKEIFLRKAIIGGETSTLELRKLIKEKYNIETFNAYGLSETGGPIAQECSFHMGLHVSEDYFYVEIINPKTGNILPDGEYGELVITPLQQEAMPLIRYRTRDITRIIPGKCPCGRTHRRIEPITHRIDDMMIINGVNVFPSQIEECIYKHISTATNYLIHITEKNGLKKLLIDIELPNDLLNNVEEIKKLEKKLQTTLKAYITVTPKLNFIPVGNLPEVQGKTCRVVRD